MTIEHLVPQSVNEKLRDEYSNCALCCRLCNTARSNKPVEREGMRLLDPTKSPWSKHFRRVGDSLLPVPDDSDAAYTHIAYDIDSPTKIKFREIRRNTVDKQRSFIRRALELETKLLARASNISVANPVASQELIEAASVLREGIGCAMMDLEQCLPIPIDAAVHCRCVPITRPLLPDELEHQLIEVRI
jgi:hypothetical protein